MLKRKQIIFSLIGVILVLSFIIKTSRSNSLLLADSTEKVAKNHQPKQVTLTTKMLPQQQLPAHPVSRSVNELQETIHTILDDQRLDGAITGVSVRQVEDESLLFTYDADTRLRPASNMKIITSIAALETLGPDYQFSTEVRAGGSVQNGVLDGDLYLVGKGDPTLQKKDFDDLAKEVSEHGIKTITGAIIADDHWYDDVRYSQDLHWTDETNYTGAAISALTASPNDDHLSGSIIVDVFPAKNAGEKPKVRITPETDYVTVVNNAQTVGQNEANTLTTERKHGSNKLIVEGNIPVHSTQYHRWRSVWEPTGYALDLFKKSLKEQGIEYDDENLQIGSVPKNAEDLAIKKSQPLKDLILSFMKLSNNGMGEVFVKEMGKAVYDEGSWDKGLEVVKETMEELGMSTDDVVFRDGSGMSHNNLISANYFTSLLVNLQDESWYPSFENSLPIAGDPSRLVGGTLMDRMVGEETKDNVKAKTGKLKGVSTLSGYVTSKDGVKLAFSIMMNNYTKGPVTDIQDQIVTVLAEAEVK